MGLSVTLQKQIYNVFKEIILSWLDMRTNKRPLFTPKMHNSLWGIIQVKEKLNYF